MTVATKERQTRSAKGEFVTWWCKEGHELQVHPGATAVWCGLAGHKRTNAMRPKDLFPNWGPA